MNVKDNSPLTAEQLAAIPQLAKMLVGQPLKALGEAGVFLMPDRLGQSENLDQNQCVLRQDYSGCWTTNVMGFFSYQGETLTITSRFAGDEDDFFLNYLLSRSLNLPDVMHGLVPAETSHNLVDLLPYVFATYLKAAMRKGPYRCYVEHAESSASVRGRIDLQKQVETANWFDGKIAYRRRELTADNYVMQLIRCVIEQLAGQAALAPLLQVVRREVSQVRELTTYSPGELPHLIYRNQQRPVRHAYYHEYQLLQRLALLLAAHRRAMLGSGSSHLMGVAFDGATLWEDYLAQLLPAAFTHPNNRRQSGGRRLFEDVDTGSQAGLVYPDFIGSVNAQAILADAKYKRPARIGGDDYLQMLAYLLRFQARRGIFLYPALPDQPRFTRLQLLQGMNSPYQVNQEIDVLKLGLVIPQECQNYQEFASEIRRNEQMFVETIAGYLPA